MFSKVPTVLCLVFIICYVTFASGKSSYIDLVRSERELIRNAKRTCFSEFGLDQSTPIPSNILSTDPKTACSFYCTLHELNVVNENGLNEILTEGIPNNEAKSRNVAKKYQELCYENPRTEHPQAFMEAQRAFTQLSPKILQQIASIYSTWAIVTEN